MPTIEQFKSAIQNSGSRANQFRVQINFPTSIPNAILAGQQLQFLAKASSLPASTVENIQTMYRGRPVNFAGERTFQPWNITVFNSADFVVRNAFETWIDMIAHSDSTFGAMQTSSYQVDAQVQQLDRNDVILKEYNFHDMFPTEIGTIVLDWDTNNQIEVFEVNFQYNYFVSNTSRGPFVA